jgi:hypothetical protein
VARPPWPRAPCCARGALGIGQGRVLGSSQPAMPDVGVPIGRLIATLGRRVRGPLAGPLAGPPPPAAAPPTADHRGRARRERHERREQR